MKDIRNKAVVSARWTMLYRYVSIVMNFIAGIYLARMIAPGVFGHIGLMAAIISCITLASMWGFSSAIMKQPGGAKDNLEYIGTLFTIDVIVSGITLVIVLIVNLLFWKTFGIVLLVMTLGAAMRLFTEIHRAVLIKDIIFHRWFIIHMTSTSLAIVCACWLAYKGFGLWALALKDFIDNALMGILSFFLSPYRIRFRFNREMAKDFYDFGKYVFASSAIEGGARNIDKISLGSFVGASALGFYGRAQTLATYIHSMFWSALNPVFYSVFGNFKDDRVRLSRVYNLSNAFFLRIYILFFIWLGIFIPEITVILYGEKWLPIVPILRLLIPFFALSGLRQINYQLLQNTGHSRVAANAQIVEFTCLLVFLFPLIFFIKTQGVVLALNISTITAMIFLVMQVRRLVDVDLKQIFFMPVVVSAATLLIFYAFKKIFPIANVYFYILTNSIIIFGVYGLCSVFFEYSFVKDIISLARVKK